MSIPIYSRGLWLTSLLFGLALADSTRHRYEDEEGLPYVTTSTYARERDFRTMYQVSSGNQTPVQVKHPSIASAPSTPILQRRPSKSSFFSKSDRPTSSSSTSASFSTSVLSKEDYESWERSSSTRTPSLSYQSSGSESGHGGQEWEDNRRQDNLLPLTLVNSNLRYEQEDGKSQLYPSSGRPRSVEAKQVEGKARPKLSPRSRSSSGPLVSKNSREDLGHQTEGTLKTKASLTQKLFSSRSRSPSNVVDKPKSKKSVSNLLGDSDFNLPPLSAPAALDVYESHQSFGSSKERLDDETEEMVQDEIKSSGRMRRSFGGKSSLSGSSEANSQFSGMDDKKFLENVEDRYWLDHPNPVQNKMTSFHSEGSSQDFERFCQDEASRSSSKFPERTRLERRGSNASSSSNSNSNFKTSRPRTRGLDKTPSSASLRPESRGSSEVEPQRFGSTREVSRVRSRTAEVENLDTSTSSGSNTPPSNSQTTPRRKVTSRRPKTTSGVVQASSHDASRPVNARTTSGHQLSVVGGHANLFHSSDSPFTAPSGPFSSYSTQSAEDEEEIQRFFMEEQSRIANRMEGRKKSKFMSGFSKFLH